MTVSCHCILGSKQIGTRCCTIVRCVLCLPPSPNSYFTRPLRPACGILAPIPGGGDAAGDAVTMKSVGNLPFLCNLGFSRRKPLYRKGPLVNKESRKRIVSSGRHPVDKMFGKSCVSNIISDRHD